MALPRLLAYAAVLVVCALAGAGVVPASQDAGAGMALAVGTALALPSVVLGVLVATRRPRSVVGLLLVLAGATPVHLAVGDSYANLAGRHPGLLVSEVYAALSQGDWMLLYVPAALLTLVFPDGRLPGRRWRWAVAGLLVVPVLFMLVVACVPGAYPPPFESTPHLLRPPEAYLPLLEIAGVALLPVFLGLLVASAAAMVIRYRRAADEISRARLKWFALGGGFLPLTLLLCWASYLFLGSSDLVVIGLAATAVSIPVATAIAVLRHDLYDVDRAISAAVTYGMVTAVLLGFYTAASFLVGLGAGRGSPVAAAAATAVCAAALSPLRVRLQRRVDRRLYPARQAVLTAVRHLRDRMHEGQARPEELEAALREALRDPELRVGYRLPGATGPVDATGATGLVDATGAPVDPGDSPVTPVRLGGHEIGAIVRGRAGSRELLREAADASALLIEVVRLRIEVSRALDEAEASRTRLLHAGYEERRRLERDLHDGAQQRLVSLGMAIRLAQRHLGDGSADVGALLDEWVAELAVAVTELRQIAHGLRPSSLDDGLGNALVTLAGKIPVPVALDVSADDLPDDVAMTAYYVASEAMTNAVKHAGPAAIGVRVSRTGDRVTVRISDDGRGGAEMRPGAGLAGLADRVRASGGALRLSSPEGGGTTVEAVLPCAS
ncbi:two-component sensor histidine kinase [Microbispora sp. NEAU-D428]|uniref:sensor histidine kinase n=1 Tax=Microbispora sitophila TaxID=2771537 RepID=UPI001867E80D|nr:histidine kinase [Microbispora sitophila]MBE3008939.1 two-component sensor histidine kinase [Microbispora sitophila]